MSRTQGRQPVAPRPRAAWQVDGRVLTRDGDGFAGVSPGLPSSPQPGTPGVFAGLPRSTWWGSWMGSLPTIPQDFSLTAPQWPVAAPQSPSVSLPLTLRGSPPGGSRLGWSPQSHLPRLWGQLALQPQRSEGPKKRRCCVVQLFLTLSVWAGTRKVCSPPRAAPSGS